MEKEKCAIYLNKYKVYSNGTVYSIAFKRWIKFNKNTKNKYQFYMFPKPESKPVKVYIHRLIAELFLENPLGLTQINHKNGDKSDNRVENLEYCTPSQNMIHAYKTGLRQSKLSEAQVRHIRTHEMEVSQRILSLKYGVSKTSISFIKNGTNWTHLL